MPLVTPRHSKQINCEVYHNHSDCTESNNIEKKYFAWGVGKKRLCKHCEDLGDKDAILKKSIESTNIWTMGFSLKNIAAIGIGNS
jgi:hypothetical protein